MDYVSTTQAAKRLEVSQTRVTIFIREGRLPAEKVGNVWMIHKDDLEAFSKKPRFEGWPKGRLRKTEGHSSN